MVDVLVLLLWILFLGFWGTSCQIIQRLQHGCSLLHAVGPDLKWSVLLAPLAPNPPARDLTVMPGVLLGFVWQTLGLVLESLGVFSVCGVKSASDRPWGRGVDVYKEQAAQHKTRGAPGTCWHVQGNHPLRPFPALLSYESMKFLDIIADYFHFPRELADNA